MKQIEQLRNTMAMEKDPIREHLRKECRKIRKDYHWLVGRTFTKALSLNSQKPHAYEVRLLCAKYTSIDEFIINQWKNRLGCNFYSVEACYEHLAIVFYKLAEKTT